MSFRLCNSERQTGQNVAKKNKKAGRSFSIRLAKVTTVPSARLISKSGTRSPTLLPTLAVTTGAVVAVGAGVDVGGTGVDVGGTGVGDGGCVGIAVGGGAVG